MSQSSSTPTEITRRNQALVALNRLGLEIGSQLEMGDLLRLIIRYAVDLLDDSAGGSINLYDPVHNCLKLVEGVGETTQHIGSTILPGEGMVGRVFESNTSLVIEDYQTWKGRMPRFAQIPAHAILVVPLRWQERVIGTLTVYSENEERLYNEDDVWLAELFAAQAAIAITNARLFEASQRRAQAFDALSHITVELLSSTDMRNTLQVIARKTLEQSKADDIHIYFYDPKEDDLTFGTSLWRDTDDFDRKFSPPRPDGLTATVARTGERMIISDPLRHPLFSNAIKKWDWNFHTLVGLPLKVSNEVVGVFNVFFKQAISIELLHFLDLLAAQAAIAIHNARLHEESHRAQERFRDIALSTSDWLWEADPDGIITYCSERITPALGYTVEELIGQRVFQYVKPEERRRLVASVDLASIDGSLLLDFETTFFHKQGHEILLRVTGIPIFDEDDQFTGWRGSARDVTAQREAERREKLVYELGQQLVTVLSLEELVEAVVEQVNMLLGYYLVHIFLFDREEEMLIISAGTSDLADKEDDYFKIPLDTTPSIVAEAGRTRQMVVANDVENDPLYLYSPSLPDTHAEVACPLYRGKMLLGVLDVQSTEANCFGETDLRLLQNLAAQISIAIENARLYQTLEQQAVHLESLVKERTAEIAQERERLMAIVTHAVEGIIFTGVGGAVEYVNPAWERMTGIKAQDAYGRQTFEVFADAHFLTDDEMPHIKAGEVWQSEFKARRPDGSEYVGAISIAPVLDKEGKVANMVGVMRDITAQKHVEEMRKKFVANVSHELRTPITNLKLYHSLIRTGSEEKRVFYLDTMAEQLSRLERLIEDLLDLSRLDRELPTLKLEEVKINELVHELIRAHLPRAEKRGLSLTTDLQDALPLLMIDRERMMQVLVNLLANAINYTDEGNKLGIRTWLDEEEDRPQVALSVWDTGAGIAPGDIAFVFDRFFRSESAKDANVPGTGLGLSIVKEIVELHNGTIKVESTLGKGSTFTVRLPVKAK